METPLEGEGVRAGQVGEDDDEGEGKEQDFDDAAGGQRPLRVESLPNGWSRARFP